MQIRDDKVRSDNSQANRALLSPIVPTAKGRAFERLCKYAKRLRELAEQLSHSIANDGDELIITELLIDVLDCEIDAVKH